MKLTIKYFEPYFATMGDDGGFEEGAALQTPGTPTFVVARMHATMFLEYAEFDFCPHEPPSSFWGRKGWVEHGQKNMVREIFLVVDGSSVDEGDEQDIYLFYDFLNFEGITQFLGNLKRENVVYIKAMKAMKKFIKKA